jgi:hypothetical protein
MLKKLFRYDFKAMGRTLFPMTLATLGCGIVMLLSVIVLNFVPEKGVFSVLLPLLFGALVFFAALTIVLLPIVGVFFILHRYYKNFFTDEGYLTFALPATMEEHLHAKILSGALWSLLSSLASVAAFVIGAYLPTLFLSSDGGGILSLFAMLMPELFAGANEIYLLLLLILSILVSLIGQIILFYTAITLGSLFMSKHKIVGSVLFYFVVNTVTGLISSVFATIFAVFSAISENMAFMTMMSLASAIVASIGIAVIEYFITLSMLKKRLNLE